jgi:membrane associated rhomboid family serine protease
VLGTARFTTAYLTSGILGNVFTYVIGSSPASLGLFFIVYLCFLCYFFIFQVFLSVMFFFFFKYLKFYRFIMTNIM